ncbi:hypothetical protein VNO78_22385 [Psophocarpus tetragonolobus]|uniref:Uncharacterized protein n=1 Tax=Psophocarpus tetragonolobus TaxID=3891 RepID=A0AAN9SD60_PSOTE
MVEVEPMGKPAPFSVIEVWTSTVLGYMVCSGLPSNVKKVFHPIICCALSTDFTTLAFGYFSKSGLELVLA